MAQQYAPQSPSPLHSVRNASDDSIDASASASPSFASLASKEAGVAATSMQAHEEGSEHGRDEEAASTAAREGQFARNRDRLLEGLGKTKEILNDLKEFNYGRWIVHYPEVNPPSYTLPSSLSSTSAAGTQDDTQVLKRSASGTALASSASASADAEADAEPVAARRPPLEHGSTTAALPTRAKPIRSSTYSPAIEASAGEGREEQAEVEEAEMNDLSILRLDLKVGHQTTTMIPSSSSSSSPNLSRQASTASTTAQPLVHSLEKSSIAQLLDGRMTQAVRHLDALRLRISDKQSKVLVTGDLNAGKSTLVNALLRREVMPTDQQPCTTVFAEVLDADEENAGKEEIHVVRDGRVYRQEDEASFMRLELDEGEKLAALMEGPHSSSSTELTKTNSNDGSMPLVKVFCRDRRSTQESLLRNGVVDIALIDAPGLNRDSLKTTALFARQEEIDVIVFVVNAENHFTLSAKEFLWNASNEKAYIFIVVNKFDQIRNKDKCKRLVLEQIKQLSPRTYEDAEELVHFVDSSAVFPTQEQEQEEEEEDSTPLDTPLSDSGDSPTKKLAGEMISAPSTPGSYRSSGDLSIVGAKQNIESSLAFAKLEASLRDFVLLKRSKSKLMPAQTYVLRLLSDIAFLAKTNATVARSELEQAKAQLLDARPALADCKKRSEKLALVLEDEEDETIVKSTKSAQDQLDKALQLVAQGRLPHKSVSLPAYPGLFDVWQYAEKVRAAMLEGLEAAVKEVEEETKQSTASAVALVKSIGEAHLPSDVEPSQRVFLPDAMFSTRRGKLSAKLYGPSAGLGISNQFAWLGLGIDVVGVRATDILDVPHYLQAIFPAFLTRHGGNAAGKVNADGTPRKALTSEEEAGLAGSLTLGLGALTLVSGKALGAKAAVEAFVRVFDLIGNKTARKWAGPVLAVGVAGAVVYVIMDLPKSIPRNVGRSIQAAGVQPPINVNKLVRLGDDTTASTATDAAPTTFTAVHTQRVSREVRKVMRLASWDLQETFRQAISERSKQVTDAEAQEKLASEAVAYFEKTGKQARNVRQEVEQVRIRDEVLPITTA